MPFFLRAGDASLRCGGNRAFVMRLDRAVIRHRCCCMTVADSSLLYVCNICTLPAGHDVTCEQHGAGIQKQPASSITQQQSNNQQYEQ